MLYNIIGDDDDEENTEEVPPPLCHSFTRPNKADAVNGLYSRFGSP